jgi:hypothetical protein
MWIVDKNNRPMRKGVGGGNIVLQVAADFSAQR